MKIHTLQTDTTRCQFALVSGVTMAKRCYISNLLELANHGDNIPQKTNRIGVGPIRLSAILDMEIISKFKGIESLQLVFKTSIQVIAIT